MKKILLLILTLALTAALLMLTACQSQDGEEDVAVVQEITDLQALLDNLLENIEYTDTLYALDKDTSLSLYGLESDAVDNFVLLSGSASTQELAIIEVADGTEVSVIEESVNARIAKQKEDYASYMPEAAKLLDDAIVETYGSVVIFTVAPDSGLALAAIESAISEQAE